MRRTHLVLIAAGVAGLLAEAIGAAIVRDPGAAHNDSLHRYYAGSLRPGATLSQAFFMSDDGLSGLSVRPYVGAPSSGALDIEVWELPRDDRARKRLVSRQHVSLTSLASDVPLTVGFAPQPSAQTWFEVVLRVADDATPNAFGFLATGGDSYAPGQFRVNGQVRWGALTLTAAIHPRAPVTTFVERLRAARVSYPGVIWAMLLIVTNLLFVVVAVGVVDAVRVDPHE